MICIHDYPEKLPNLRGQINQYLTSNNELQVYTGLLGLFSLTSKYEFEIDEDRIPLHEILGESFSVLGSLVNNMISHMENPDALQMLHRICKIFYAGNHMQMCPFLMKDKNLDPWILFFKTILDMECP